LASDHQGVVSITIRTAKLDDAAALAELSTQLGYPATEDDARRRMGRIGANAESVVLVATLPDGSVIGWLHAYLCCLVESDLYAEIGGLVVDQQHRGSGAGSLLVQHAEQWARSENCNTVSVRSNVIREGAHAFYLHLGYKIAKTQHAFRKIL
jgi:GNAT superfamily N-acetyltransferase